MDLISKYFSNIKLFWQQYLDGSLILPVNEQFNCSNPINLADGTSKKYDSLYDIIIASNDENNIIIPYYASFYPIEFEDIVRPFVEKYNSVLNSHAFKLGCLLLKPVYWIKKMWNKQ